VITRLFLTLVLCCGWAAAQSIGSLIPTSAPAGTPVLLTITGSGFIPNSTYVVWDRTAIAGPSVRVTSPNILTVDIPATLLVAPGSIGVTVVNPGGGAATTTFTITPDPSRNVTITPETLPAAAVGVAYAQTLTAVPATIAPTWTISAGALPPGLGLNTATGLISGTPTTAGAYTFTVNAAVNSAASATKSYTLTVTGARITTTSPLPAATAGKAYQTRLTAEGTSAAVQWTASGLPPWLQLDRSAGVLSGTPPVPGTFQFTVQLTDGNTSVSLSAQLTVNPAPMAIRTIAPLFTGVTGLAYTQRFEAEGGVPPYRWSILPSEPPGLTLDRSAGVLQGTPTAAGEYPITVQVADSANNTAQAAFSVVVNAPSLTITPGAALPPATALAPYTQTFTAVGGTAPYIWTQTGGDIPGLSFDRNAVRLSGTPTTQGDYSFSLQVRDSAGLTASRTFTLTVGASALRVVPGDPVEATLKLPYDFRVSATGGTPPYAWAATGLPEGLSIDPASGSISGIPLAAGSFPTAVRVTDSQRNTSVELFRIVVRLPPPPALSASGLPPVASPASQFPLVVSIAEPYDVSIAGEAVLTFAPDAGLGDSTVQFASGGRVASFTIPEASRDVVSAAPLAIQTGTVAGSITITIRLVAGGTEIAQTQLRTRIERSAPVIRSARLTRTGGGFSIEIAGYSTAREVVQASFNFSAAPGQSLLAPTVNVPVEELFGKWFQDVSSAPFGSQFVFTQPFTVQGDASAVVPDSVTLSNRVGSTTAAIEK
jgi:hypothetical protein